VLVVILSIYLAFEHPVSEKQETRYRTTPNEQDPRQREVRGGGTFKKNEIKLETEQEIKERSTCNKGKL
jgi:hypothetical protein